MGNYIGGFVQKKPLATLNTGRLGTKVDLHLGGRGGGGGVFWGCFVGHWVPKVVVTARLFLLSQAVKKAVE